MTYWYNDGKSFSFLKRQSPHATDWEAAMSTNPWSRPKAADFWMIPTVEEAANMLGFNDWSRDTAFWIGEYPEIGFANQCVGGEWRVMRRNMGFDSLSGWAYADADKLHDFCERVMAATDDELLHWGW